MLQVPEDPCAPYALSKFVQAGKPRLPLPGPNGKLPAHPGQVAVALTQVAYGRIEEHQAGESGGLLLAEQGNHRREGMEHADERLWPIAGGDCVSDFSHISQEVGHVMPAKMANGVPAVISQVIQEEVELLGEPGPQRKIEITSESIAVGEEDAWTARIAVAAEADRRSVLHGKDNLCGWSGKSNHCGAPAESWRRRVPVLARMFRLRPSGRILFNQLAQMRLQLGESQTCFLLNPPDTGLGTVLHVGSDEGLVVQPLELPYCPPDVAPTLVILISLLL